MIGQEWHIRCAWVIGPPPPGAPPGPQASGFVLAGDEPERPLIVHGELEDGFLRVDAILAGPAGSDAAPMPLAVSLRTVEERCAAAVQRLQQKGPAEVYAIAAVPEDDDVGVSMAFPPRAAGDVVTRLVIFGDSLSDTGNLKRRLKVFPDSPYWLGRFSNGPNWIDWLARATGVAVQDHSYGGALAEPHEDVSARDVIAAIEQGGQHFVSGSVDRYVDDYIARDLLTGAVVRPRETVFILWEGSNDYLAKEPFTDDIGTLLDAPQGEAGYRARSSGIWFIPAAISIAGSPGSSKPTSREPA